MFKESKKLAILFSFHINHGAVSFFLLFLSVQIFSLKWYILFCLFIYLLWLSDWMGWLVVYCLGGRLVDERFSIIWLPNCVNDWTVVGLCYYWVYWMISDVMCVNSRLLYSIVEVMTWLMLLILKYFSILVYFEILW